MTASFPLQVWAPDAASVDAIAGAEPISLRPDSERPGWWTCDKTFPPGTRYGFFPAGVDTPLPDPRSPSQPDGIHGLSCIVDHTDFPWTDGDWQPTAWPDAVIYELHIGTFSEEGTFESAIPHLGDLVQLGVTHVELMPVCEFPGKRGWGYDGVGIFAPHHAYGGPEGLKKLVDACHAAGLGVIIDVVYNHMGPDGNYAPRFAPYFSSRHLTPWGDGPNLDGEHAAEARGFFIDNALMWLRDYRADGLRLDAIDKVKDDSNKHFLVELREAVDALEREAGRPKVLIAESAANDPIYVQPIADGGYGMTAVWNDDFHHALRTLFTREDETYYMDFGGELSLLVKAMRQGFVYDGIHSKFRDKPHGKSPAGVPPTRMLAYLQTHDQVGNRARGDRFHHHPASGIMAQKVAAALVFLSPYVPMVFMGEEWAATSPFLYFTDHEDPELQKAVSEGRKAEFGGSQWEGHVPDPQDMDTFLSSKLLWEERSAGEHADMLEWYTALIRLRKSHPALRSSESPVWEVDSDPDGSWISLTRGVVRLVAAVTPAGSATPYAAPRKFLLQSGDLQDGGGERLIFKGLGVAIYEAPELQESSDAQS